MRTVPRLVLEVRELEGRQQWCGIICVDVIFFFAHPATTEIYTLSLHDALPISWPVIGPGFERCVSAGETSFFTDRSEEHTSELQSRGHLVCRLLLEKKTTRQAAAPPEYGC